MNDVWVTLAACATATKRVRLGTGVTNTVTRHPAVTAELLFTARLRRGLTARELSTLSGVPQSTVSRIESGKMSPSYDIMRTLLATLGFESSDTLRPAVSNAPLVRFMDDYERGLIPDRTVLDRMRIAAQTSGPTVRLGT